MKIIIGKYKISEKPIKKRFWKGVYKITNGIAIISCSVAAVILQSMNLAYISAIICTQYFFGELLLYHKLEVST